MMSLILSLLMLTGCGYLFKPLPTLECRDFVAECVCDEHGRNCQLYWICVPRR